MRFPIELMCGVAAAAFGLAFSAIPIQASSIVLTSDSSTAFEVQHRSNTGVYSVSQNTHGTGFRAGMQSNFANDTGFGIGGIQPIYMFQLPVIPNGQTLSGATFSVSVLPDTSNAASTGAPTFNGSLYALGYDPNSPTLISGGATTSQNFFYVSSTPQTGTGAGGAPIQLLQSDFLTPSDWVANGGTIAQKDTSIAGGSSLFSYISALYADPGFTPGTDCLILRINPNVDSYNTSPFTTQRYTLSTYDSIAGAILPTLTLTTVPEPASLALLSLGGLTLIRRRR